MKKQIDKVAEKMAKTEQITKTLKGGLDFSWIEFSLSGLCNGL